ncbi:MAG: flavodoxin-dependent (E)-4-hydroxy-3-methylbut-2-enyl-diphosphate synthase [Fibrobacterota bacterium]
MKKPTRRKTRTVHVGNCAMGSDDPVRVQSMACTPTSDVRATVAQALRLADAGCEIVRVAVPDRAALAALAEIKKNIPIPLVADIHFNMELALGAIAAGCDKIRVNPGNLGGLEKFRDVIRCAKAKGCALRIGVNSGSVEKRLLEKHGGPTPQAMAESALDWLAVCDNEKFDQVVVSIKASHVLDAVLANRAFAAQCDVPLHIGITEAGGRHYGAIKSAAGLGALLLDGIGDTIRVSLTADPVEEIPVAYDILKAAGVRIVTPEVISCPTCARLQYNMEAVAAEIERRLGDVKKPVRVAVMGCVVNGPGEAREADVALAGGKGEGILFVRGKEVRRVPEAEMADAVVKAVKEF